MKPPESGSAYSIAPVTIKTPGTLLRLLIQHHYRHRSFPNSIASHLVQTLRQSGQFTDWPLEQIFSDRQRFFLFLQERWPIYLSHIASTETCTYAEVAWPLEFPGTRLLPFDEVWEQVDNLFTEGMLQPVKFPHVILSPDKRVEIGILRDSKSDAEERFRKLAGIIENELPSDKAKFSDWQLTALRWAELLNLWFDGIHKGAEAKAGFYHLQAMVDSKFAAWLDSRYAGLYSQPAVKPVMVHHVARYLARIREEKQCQKIALIVIDGLAIHQWLTIRQVIVRQRPDFTFREEAIFAWLPTSTAVSRQAIFSGKPPVYFPNSIHDTTKETVLWTQFWGDQGLPGNSVAYMKGLRKPTDIEKVDDLLSSQQLRIAGLVVDKADRIMHGMELGSLGMHNQIMLWAQSGFIADMIDCCLNHGFTVVITSDHGNVEATGIGKLSEGAIADQRGERVRVYPDEALRISILGKCPSAITGATICLPAGYYPLYAPGRSAFIENGSQSVCHGGPCIEEIMVPFVRVERKTG